MKRVLILVVAGLLISGAAFADDKDPAHMNDVQAPNFAPLGGDVCSSPDSAINDTLGPTVDVLSAGAGGGDLDVTLQISHTWVGDMSMTLSGPGCGPLQIYDRPGEPASTFGCSNNDVDAVLDDSAGSSVEDQCAAGPPAIGGTFSPSPDALAACHNQAAGDWTLTITDHAGGDNGVLNMWCLTGVGGGDGGDGGEPVPAVTTWGIMGLIALFLGISLFYMRRRAAQS